MSSSLKLLHFIYLDFESAPVRAHSGVGTIQWDGHDWLGFGDLGTISQVAENIDVQPARVRLTLSGVPSELVSVTLDDHY